MWPHFAWDSAKRVVSRDKTRRLNTAGPRAVTIDCLRWQPVSPAHKVDLFIAAGGIPSAQAARNATPTIPIVFTAVADRVGLLIRVVQEAARARGCSSVS